MVTKLDLTDFECNYLREKNRTKKEKEFVDAISHIMWYWKDARAWHLVVKDQMKAYVDLETGLVGPWAGLVCLK